MSERPVEDRAGTITVGHVFVGFVASLLFAFKFGLTPIPNFTESVALLTQDPTGSRLAAIDGAQYLVGSWFGPAFLNLLGVTGERSLVIIYGSFAIGAVVLSAVAISAGEASFVDRLAAVLFIPALPAIFHWVGSDSLLVLLLATAYLCRHHVVALMLVGVFAGMQHAEIAALAGLQFVVYDTARSGIRAGVTSWAGRFVWAVCGGRIVLEALFAAFDVERDSRVGLAVDQLRSSLLGWGEKCSLASALDCPPVAPIMGTLSVAVLLVPTLLLFRRPSLEEKRGMAWCLVVILFVGALVLDQTRVGVLSMTLVGFEFLRTRLTSLGPRRLSRLRVGSVLVVWLLIPLPWLWESRLHWYGLLEGGRFLFGAFT